MLPFERGTLQSASIPIGGRRCICRCLTNRCRLCSRSRCVLYIISSRNNAGRAPAISMFCRLVAHRCCSMNSVVGNIYLNILERLGMMYLPVTLKIISYSSSLRCSMALSTAALSVADGLFVASGWSWRNDKVFGWSPHVTVALGADQVYRQPRRTPPLQTPQVHNFSGLGRVHC